MGWKGMIMFKHLKYYFKFLCKCFLTNVIEVDVPIMEQATPLQKFLISAVISGNIRKG